MKKLTPQEQSGIEYIQLSRLPFKHYLPFKNWICETDIFLLTDVDGTKQECAYYDKYEFWFDTFREEKVATESMLF